MHRDLSFLPEKSAINWVTKLMCTFYDKRNYVYQIELSKQASKDALILKKVHEQT